MHLEPYMIVRRTICAQCPTPCVQQHNALHYADPAASCPLSLRRWGARTPAGAAASPPPPESSPLLTKFSRLRTELAAWARAGAKFAPKELRRARLAACRACEYYHSAGNLGFGECKHPGCGCTRIKAALASSRCPAQPSRWPA